PEALDRIDLGDHEGFRGRLGDRRSVLAGRCRSRLRRRAGQQCTHEKDRGDCAMSPHAETPSRRLSRAPTRDSTTWVADAVVALVELSVLDVPLRGAAQVRHPWPHQASGDRVELLLSHFRSNREPYPAKNVPAWTFAMA